MESCFRKKRFSGIDKKNYSYLERSIQICLVDDDPKVLETYSNILKCYSLYAVTTFSTASEANSALSSKKRFHVCILDLGLTDLDNDEFYLVKKFSPRTSFVILTGNNSIHMGFQCGKHGSFSVFEKPIDFEQIEFINTINQAFIHSLINIGNAKQNKAIIDQILESFLFCNPMNINEWAYNSCVTEQYLRRVWNTIYGYQPKYFLWFYRMMAKAFSFYNAEFLKINGILSQRNEWCPDTIDNKGAFTANNYQSHQNIFYEILNA